MRTQTFLFTIRRFSIFHALAMSIGVHLLLLLSSPPLSSSMTVTEDKKFEKVYLKIVKKPAKQSPKKMVQREIKPFTKIAARPIQPEAPSLVPRASRLRETIRPVLTSGQLRTARNVARVPVLSYDNKPSLLRQTSYSVSRGGGYVNNLEPVAAGNSSDDEYNLIWENFTSEVRTKIANAKTYPLIAREREHEGKTLLAFKLGKDGLVYDLSIVNSSGHKILDEAAIQAIRDAAPYPHIPDELNMNYALLKLPISFILRGP